MKRRGTPSPLGLARAAPLGFSRKKKGSAAFTLFSLFLFLFFSSSLHPLVFFIQLSSSFFSFSFFELLLEKKNPKKKPENLRKKKFQKKSRPFSLFHVLSLISPIFLSFLCGEFSPSSSHRVSHHLSFCCFLFYCLLSGGFVCFLLCVCCEGICRFGLVLFVALLFVCGLVVNDCHHTYQKKRSLFLILMPRFILSLSCLCSQSSLVMVVVVMVGADQTRPLF